MKLLIKHDINLPNTFAQHPIALNFPFRRDAQAKDGLYEILQFMISQKIDILMVDSYGRWILQLIIQKWREQPSVAVEEKEVQLFEKLVALYLYEFVVDPISDECHRRIRDIPFHLISLHDIMSLPISLLHLPDIKTIISKAAKNIDRENSDGRRPIDIAVLKNDPALIMFLRTTYAQLNYHNGSNCLFSYLSETQETVSLEMFQFLVSCGANILGIDSAGNTLLHQFFKYTLSNHSKHLQEVTKIAEILIPKSAKIINNANYVGLTPLMLAIMNAKISFKILKLLFDNGVDYLALDHQGSSIIHYWIVTFYRGYEGKERQREMKKITHYLLHKTRPILHKFNKTGENVLGLAIREGALYPGLVSTMLRLLCDYHTGIDVRNCSLDKNYGNTLLFSFHKGVYDAYLMKTYIKQKGDLMLRDNNNMTLLQVLLFGNNARHDQHRKMFLRLAVLHAIVLRANKEMVISLVNSYQSEKKNIVEELMDEILMTAQYYIQPYFALKMVSPYYRNYTLNSLQRFCERIKNCTMDSFSKDKVLRWKLFVQALNIKMLHEQFLITALRIKRFNHNIIGILQFIIDPSDPAYQQNHIH
jgi:ankyrin repeat protein